MPNLHLHSWSVSVKKKNKNILVEKFKIEFVFCKKKKKQTNADPKKKIVGGFYFYSTCNFGKLSKKKKNRWYPQRLPPCFRRLFSLMLNLFVHFKKKMIVWYQFFWCSVFCAFKKKTGTDLARMHDGKLVHGDLTTSNFMVPDDERELVFFYD